MDYKAGIKLKVDIIEQGSIRPYPVIKLDVLQSLHDLKRPPLAEEVDLNIDGLEKNLRGMITRMIGLNWSIGFIPKDGIAVEIGVDYGDGIERARHSPASKITGIDPFKCQDYDSWYSTSQGVMDARYESVLRRFKDDNRVSLAHTTSDDYFASSDVMAHWWFVDGDHREEPCYRDICNCFERTFIGGYVCIDDIDCATWKVGINKALDRFLNTKTYGEVEVVWRASSPAVLRRLK